MIVVHPDLKQIAVVLFVACGIYLLLQSYPAYALALMTAVVSFFVSVAIYNIFLKGGNGAVHHLGRQGIAPETQVYVFFIAAILVSGYISAYAPNYILDTLLQGSPLSQIYVIGVSLLFAIGTFIGMRALYYPRKLFDNAVLGLVGILVAFFAIAIFA